VAIALTQPAPGPWDPLPASPLLAPGSARRTTSIDATRPDGLTGDRLVVDARGRDVSVDADGTTTVVDRLALRIELDGRTGVVSAIEGEGADGLGELVGSVARSGLGRRVAALLPEESEARSLRCSVLDDLPHALLVSGFALLEAGLIVIEPEYASAMAERQADICAGWATGNPLLSTLVDHGVTACPVGPDAPAIEAADLAGWHPLPAMAVGTVRRRRQLDVAPGGDGPGLRVWSHFRDSHAGAEREMVMHEYVVAAEVDGRGSVSGVAVEPRVLPWEACPGAAPSASAVVGVPVDELAARARADLVGPTTCTHLSSTVRCLADVAALVPLLRPPA
jgi:hypothetical protein